MTVGGKMYRSCQKHKSLSLYDIFTGHQLFVFFCLQQAQSQILTKPKLHRTLQKNYRIISHARSTKPDIYLTEILRSAFIKEKWERLLPAKTGKVKCKLLSQYQ